MAHPEEAALSRRRLVIGAAGTVAGAGVAKLAWPSSTLAGSSRVTANAVVTRPNPIPGGAFDVGPPLGVIHVFAPGDPSITLPFTGLTLGGFDVEPSTITDFEARVPSRSTWAALAGATARRTTSRRTSEPSRAVTSSTA